MENKRFLTVTEVAEILGISESMAYKVMRSLNTELKEKGFITIAGRVSRDYFMSKLYPHDTASA